MSDYIGMNATTEDNLTQNNDVRTLAKEFLIYKIGKLINIFWIFFAMHQTKEYRKWV